jgi:hypothetical protein
MLITTKTALAVALVAGMTFGAAADLAYAKSGKASARGTYRSAPVYLDQAPTMRGPRYQNNWDSNLYQNWNGWAPPPAHAGGVG